VGIYSTGLRGYVEYAVNAPRNDAYRIEVEGREKNHKTPEVELPLILSLDGEFLGRYNLPYGASSNGFVHCFTPYITNGSHILRIYWDNANGYRQVYLRAIRLQSVGNGVVDAQGMKAWVADRLAAQCGVEFAPSASPVSPVCVEGRGQYLSMMSLSAGTSYPLTPLQVHNGAGYRWYANVPLSPTNGTIVRTSFQSGGRNETNEIAWQVTNLLETNSLTLRKGDSLLLTACPPGASNGEVVLSITGQGSITTDASTPVPYQFTQSGTFTVTGTYNPTGASGSITVTVAEASFENSPITRLSHPRYWICTNLPPSVVLDADPRLTLVSGNYAPGTTNPPAANERYLRVGTLSIEPEHILARAGTNGPVISSTAVRGFRWSIAPETYLRVVSVNPDGSQLIETAFVASPFYSDLSVDVQIISGGVTFDDGTITKTISPQEFDSLGSCRLRFIRPAGMKGSTCHTTMLYDGGYLIGWR
jgi:hypothetical protein